MTEKRLEQLAREQFEACIAEMTAKNQDYSGMDVSCDALGNFKQTAIRMGVTSLQAWGLYFSKHAMALERFARTGTVSSEKIAGRITDAINYLVFLLALVEESERS